jgi:hypothetical protein
VDGCQGFGCYWLELGIDTCVHKWKGNVSGSATGAWAFGFRSWFPRGRSSTARRVFPNKFIKGKVGLTTEGPCSVRERHAIDRAIFFARRNCCAILVARFRGFRSGFSGGSGPVWGAICCAFLGIIRGFWRGTCDWTAFLGILDFGFWIAHWVGDWSWVGDFFWSTLFENSDSIGAEGLGLGS